MFSEKNLKDIVDKQISKDEKLGDQAGGSGHMSYVSYSIDEIKKPEKAKIDGKDCWKIEYHYTLTVETEFTYYPDNPPYTYKYGKTIFVDGDGNLISESGREGGMVDLPWDPDDLIDPDELGKD